MATNILYLREFNKILVKYGCYNILENFYAEGIVDDLPPINRWVVSLHERFCEQL